MNKKIEKEEKIKIGVFDTPYSLLLYFLIFGTEKIYFIFDQEICRIKGKKIKNFRKNNSRNILYKIIAIIYETIYFQLFLGTKKVEIYGQSHTRLGKRLLNKGDFFEIEDGVRNYKQSLRKSKNILEKVKEKLKKKSSKNIKKIYLTGLASIPKDIENKVEIVSLKELWNNKSLEMQNEILTIFSFDLNIKEMIKEKDIILFTQPLSEDGVITESEKILIYSKIIEKYPQERLVIKTHPREKTKYRDIFKDCLVLDKPFPFEILSLLEVKFNKAVTIFSTAALGLKSDIKIDFYGTEIHPKILKKFGSCDYIMKRNVFIEEK